MKKNNINYSNSEAQKEGVSMAKIPDTPTGFLYFNNSLIENDAVLNES